MKAMFIGDPNDDFSGPKVLRMGFGKDEIVAFAKDKFVGVSDEIAAKLASHTHFRVEDGDAQAFELPPEPVATRDPLDHDNNGKKGGSRDKASIVADLERLSERFPGKVTYDARSGALKLEARLEELRFELGDDE